MKALNFNLPSTNKKNFILKETLGNKWLDKNWFRFGASSLVNDILMQIVKQSLGSYQSADYFSKD